jgi:tRNA 2-(methylsulfanyl)-N6-isopentenyladenosine37 hydroxylase
MLHLQSATDARWLRQVDENLNEVLIDHAHCEKKAAGTALNLIFHYVEDRELCQEMTEIVNEELEHFHMVIDLLDRRGVRFRRLKPSQYGRKLNDLCRRQEPQRAVDRLLVAGIIEARSCERFQALANHVEDQELATFYRSLFESEARHHATYTRLAMHFAPEKEVMRRLDELAALEAAIIAEGEELPRMHSQGTTHDHASLL